MVERKANAFETFLETSLRQPNDEHKPNQIYWNEPFRKRLEIDYVRKIFNNVNCGSA